MNCTFPSQSDAIKRMRLILSRERTDLQGGRGAVQTFDMLYREGRLVLDEDMQRYTDDVLVACKRGNVVPGLGLDLDTGECVMDWYAFACFARWYAMSVLTPGADDLQDAILQELRNGNPAPWTSAGMPPEPSPCTPVDPVTNRFCCPSSVWLDPFYANTNPLPAVSPVLVMAATAALAFGSLWWFTRR